jgi:oxygen-dependent protoporphyrinogen oxidase
LGIPLTARAIAESTMLSGEGQERVGRELVQPSPNPNPDDDQSIGAFVRRRFGDEAVRYLAQPLLGGIHAGDVDRLSLRSLFPALHDADVQPGSVLETLRQRRREPPPDGMFRSIDGGLGRLIDALADRVPDGTARLGDRAVRLRFAPHDEATSTAASALEAHAQSGAGDSARPWIVELDSGLHLRAAHIVLAVPPHVTADLVRPIDAALAELCGGISCVSTASITLSYPRATVAHPMTGTGFVIPRVDELTRLLAVSWVTSKWAGRAPKDQIMLRAFAGGVFDAERVEWDDAELVKATHDELAPLLGLSQAPVFAKVYRWRHAGPQYEVGHGQRLRAIDTRLADHPGLFITGSGFRGVGVPDNVADARRVAASILAHPGTAGPRVDAGRDNPA